MTEKYEDKDSEEYEKYLEDLKVSSNVDRRKKEQEERELNRLIPLDEIEDDDEVVEVEESSRISVPPPIYRKERDRDDDDEDDDYVIKFRGLYSASSSSEEDEPRIQEKERDEDLDDDEESVVEEDVADEDISWEDQEVLDEAGEAKQVQSTRLKRLDENVFEEYLQIGTGIDSTEQTQLRKDGEILSGQDGSTEDLEELPVLLKTMKESHEVLCNELSPILRRLKLKKEILSESGLKYLNLKYQLLQVYILNILFYFKLCIKKRNNINNSNDDFEKRRQHPVMIRLVEIRKMLEKVDKSVETQAFRDDFELVKKIFEERRKKDVEKKKKKKEKKKNKKKAEDSEMMKSFSSFKDIIGTEGEKGKKSGKKRKRGVEGPDIDKRPKKKRKKSRVMQRLEEDRMFSIRPKEGSHDKREVHPNIMKSKGIRERGKEFLHPRIKRRMTYHDKTKEMRENESRFDEEKGGLYKGENKIRKNTVRSRRLRK